MSHFYGTLEGNRGMATRCGTKSSGMVTYTAGWHGAIRTIIDHREDGSDVFMVELIPWQSSGGKTRLLAEGVLDANAEHDNV